MKKILLTGISGMLGQMLYNGLKDRYEIYGLDQRITQEDKKNFQADISNFESLTEIFYKLRPIDAVVHFAADPYPFAHWDLLLKDNIVGTKNIYECCKIFKIPKVVFASSTHTIGKYPGYPHEIIFETDEPPPPRGGVPPQAGRTDNRKMLTPQDPVRPDEFYGLSKAVGESIGRTYSDLYNIHSLNLRIGHTTGQTPPDHDLDKIELYEEDLVDIVQKSIEVDVKFGIYFAISDVPGRFLDIVNAKNELGYNPRKR